MSFQDISKHSSPAILVVMGLQHGSISLSDASGDRFKKRMCFPNDSNFSITILVGKAAFGDLRNTDKAPYILEMGKVIVI